MSTGLRERLDEVAGRAPAGAPPEDLWQRGRRRQVRRAVAGAVATVVVAMAAGVGGAVAWAELGRETQPVAPSPGQLRLPDHVYTPGFWLAGTDDAGPIGPLAALIGGPRSSWRGWKTETDNSVAGISTSGDYRYLDLPGWVGDYDISGSGEVVLSPDGRYVAYWATGPTTDEPVLEDNGQVAGAAAVYDTVTGRTHRREISSAHGLSGWGISWAGDTVLMSYGDNGPPSPTSRVSRLTGYASWDADSSWWSLTAQPKVVMDGSFDGVRNFVVAEKTNLLVGSEGVEGRFRTDTATEGGLVPSPDGRRVAGIFRPRGSESVGEFARRIVVADLAEVGARGRAVGVKVPDFKAQEVYGWRDDRHVVVERWGAEAGIYSVDISTGEATLLVTRVRSDYGGDLQVAAEAWQAPTVEVTEPRWPWDPRLKAGLVAGALLLVWALVRVWRRRRGRA